MRFFGNYTICSINDLLKCIHDCKNMDHGSWHWYRGHGDESWNLLPSIARCPYNKSKYEQYMSTNFYVEVSKRKKDLPSDNASWLCYMQHYGLPTRLLDWSESPLVALYFAVCNEKEYNVDGKLWILDPIQLNKSQGYGSYVPPMDVDYGIIDRLIKPVFNNKIKSPEEIIATRTVDSDLRMYVQQSAFTIHGVRTPLEDYEAKLKAKDNILSSVIIPKEH
ncbi:hypothetical protein FACS1894184_03420 [Clostridia bacterium]|nr:hypothetical protein FACS1894184_03420 [Clostridia bacterium]